MMQSDEIVFLSGKVVADDLSAPVGILVSEDKTSAPVKEEVKEAPVKEQGARPAPVKAPEPKASDAQSAAHEQWTGTVEGDNLTASANSTQEVLSTSYSSESAEKKPQRRPQNPVTKANLDPWANAKTTKKPAAKPANTTQKTQKNNKKEEEQIMATDDKKTKKATDQKKAPVAKAEPAKKPAAKAEPAKKPATKAEPQKAEKKPAAKAAEAPKADVKKPVAKPEANPEKVLVEGDPNSAHGKFVIKKTDNGNFVYKLYSSNARVLASPGGAYKDLSSCKSGVQSVITNAATAPIEDTTLKKYEEQKCPKWVIYVDKAGEFRLRLIASNGNVVAITNDGYTTKDAAKKGIDAIARAAKGASIVRNDTLW